VHPLLRELGQRYLDHIARLDIEIGELEKRLRQLCRNDETSVRLQTMPGIGPVTAAAIEAFCPTDGGIQARARFCRLARQAETGPDIQDGAA
jgi:transposase